MVDRTVRTVLGLENGPFLAGIAQADGAANNFARRMNDLGNKSTGLDKLQKSIIKSKGEINDLSNRSLIAGGVIAAGVVVAAKGFADFDQAMSDVAATGDDARNSLTQLRTAAVDAGARTKYSATEAAQGIEALEKAGVSAKDILAGGLDGALDLAAAGSIDVGEAAETAATALTQFRLEGAQVPHVADLLAAGAGKAQGEVHDLAMALKQSGLVASQFGLSIEDTTGTLAAFASAGLIGSDAGTSFKTMLIALANPSKKSADEMARLGINAYDAQGKFVGITNLAGQLQQKLGGLTEETRNQALAQIFGNDALRAANVLFVQGSSGIQQWIDKTNDSGYAAEVASIKMDNLKGDVEKLMGALETAAIGAGSGGNEFLRDFVQSISGLIDGFNELSPAAQKTFFQVAAGAAGVLLTAGAVGKLAVSVAEARAAVSTLALGFPRMAAGMSSVAAAAGPAAVAVLGVVAAAHALDQLSSKNKGTDELVRDLQEISKGSGDLNNLYTQGNWADAIMGSLTGAMPVAEDFSKALQAVNDATNPEGFFGWAAGVEKMKEGLIPGTQGLEKMQQQMTGVDDALVKLVQGGHADQAIKAFNGIAQQAEAQGISMSDLMNIFPQYADAIKGVETSTDAANPAMAEASAALDKIASDSQNAADALQASTDAMFDQANAALQLSGSQIGFEQAIDDASEAAKKNGKTLDLNTQKGRDNQKALDNLAASSSKYVENLILQGKSSDEVGKATQRARDKFIATARSMSLSKEAAEALADSLGLIPADTKAAVSAPGAKQSKEEADEVRTAIRNLPKSTQTYVLSEFKRGGIDAARAALRAIDGATATTYINTVHNVITKASDGSGRNVRVKVPKNAGGGRLVGPGTGTSDSILGVDEITGMPRVAVSTDEWIIKAKTSRSYGDPIMGAFNEGRIPREVLAPYALASGGKIAGRASGGPLPAVDTSTLWRMINAVINPLYELQKLQLASARAAQELARANASVKKEQADLKKAQSAVDRSNKTKTQSDDKRADAAKRKAADDLAKAQDKLRDAQDKAKQSADDLKQAQQQYAQEALQTANSLKQPYDTRSTDPLDILARKQEGAADLAKFNTQLAQLRKLGLSDTNLQEIVDRGALEGGEVAAEVIKGGKKLVDALNKAQKNLDDAAKKVGYTDASLRRAGGGLIDFGPDGEDKVKLWATRYEYVTQPKAVRYYGVEAMDDINQMRIPKAALSRQVKTARVYTQEKQWAVAGIGGIGQPSKQGRNLEVNFNGPVGAQASEVVSIMDSRANVVMAMDGLEYAGG